MGGLLQSLMRWWPVGFCHLHDLVYYAVCHAVLFNHALRCAVFSKNLRQMRLDNDLAVPERAQTTTCLMHDWSVTAAVPFARRHFPPDFYYNQEDYLASRLAEGASWTYNVLRPGPICGFSEGSFMNIVTSTALYCTLCKELNIGVLRCVFAAIVSTRTRI